MTRKEAIAELKRDIELENDFTEDYINAVNMAIEALEEVGCEDYINRKVALDDYIRTRDCFKAWHWIPVSEKLPMKGTQVLCCNKYGSVFTSELTWSKGYLMFGQHSNVIAWMPLPEPYKEESKTEQALAYADQDTLMSAT